MEVFMKRVRKTFGFLVGGFFLASVLNSCVATSAVVAAAAIAASTPNPTPTYVIQGSYPTTHVVTQVATRPVAQNVTVSATTTDISYNLDLQAVGNIFSVSSSLEDFERRLNAYDAQISNLDLNRDGYVDYLRVVEVQEGYTHLVVLQAVLAQDIYQDVATIEVEKIGSTPAVTIIGDPYIYGTSYVLRPTYMSAPVIVNYFYGPSYRVWRSPYYWGYYPTHYRPRTCVHVNVYRQHIVRHNQKHHHTYHYIDDYKPRFEGIRNTVSRNDYAVAHPEESFNRRNTEVRNARAIETENTRRTAVKSTEAVKQEVKSTARRADASTATTPKVSTTVNKTSSSRRTTTSSSATTTPTDANSSSTTTSSRRTNEATAKDATTTTKTNNTTTNSTSRRTTTTVERTTTTVPATTTVPTTSSRRTNSATSTTTNASTTKKSSTSTSSNSSTSRRSNTATTSSAKVKSAASTVKASTSATSTPKVSTSTSSSTRRSTTTSSSSSSRSTGTTSSSSSRTTGSRR